MTTDYIPELPNPLKPPIPELTTLSDWKEATDTGLLTRRKNKHILEIDKALQKYHDAGRLWQKYIELEKITNEASAWLTQKDKLTNEKSSRKPAVHAIRNHSMALRRWPTLELIDGIGFRGDGRNPGEIFQSGFWPAKGSNPISIGEDGHTWAEGNASKSQVVGVSLRVFNLIGHYAAGQYLYAVKIREGIDLKENGDFEIALLQVANTDVIACIGRLAGTSKFPDDAQTTRPLEFLGESQYVENHQCAVPLHESRLAKAWLKKMAGQPCSQQDGADLINKLYGMGQYDVFR